MTGRVLVAAVAAALVALPAVARERVAQLSAIDGDVSIERREGRVDKARQVGPRVRNGSIYGGDVVRTGGDSEATMIFSDGSEVRLRADGALSVREVDLSALVAVGRAEKPIGRTIRVLAGNVWSNVSPNPSISTEFETPSGVAAVKGTVVEIGVGEETEDFGCREGDCEFEHASTGLFLDVRDGYGFSTRTIPATLTSTPPRATTPTRGVDLEVARDAAVVEDFDGDGEMSAGDVVLVRLRVRNPDSRKTVRKVKLFHAPDERLRLDPESLSTTHGEIARSQPLEVEIGELGPAGIGEVRFEAIVLPEIDDSITVEAHASNPGPLRMRAANGRELTASPGSRFRAARAGFGVTLAFELGEMLYDDHPLAFGEQIRWANPVFSSSTVPVGISTEEGSVEVTNARHGVRTTVDAGFGLQVANTERGGLAVSVPGTNPAQLEISAGGSKAAVDPGSALEAQTQQGDLEVAVTVGTVTLTDADGNEQKVSSGETARTEKSEEIESEEDEEADDAESEEDEGQEEEEDDAAAGASEDDVQEDAAAADDEEESPDDTAQTQADQGQKKPPPRRTPPPSRFAGGNADLSGGSGEGGSGQIGVQCITDAECNSECVVGATCSNGFCVGGSPPASPPNSCF